MMWKKIIWSCATFMGGSFLIWTNNGIIVHLQPPNHSKKPFENDSSHILLPDHTDTAFNDDAKSSWFSFIEDKTSKYWDLLLLTKSKKQNVRHMAIKSLTELSNLEDWQYKMIAQACDSRTAVGLARIPDVNVSFFLSPPKIDLKEVNLKEDFLKLVISLPILDTDVCLKLLAEQAKFLAHQLLKEQKDWNSEIEDSYALFHSERRKEEELIFDKVSLQTLLGLSSLKSNINIMLEKGVLKFLSGVLQYHENDTEFQSLIAQILANIALEKTSVNAFHISGWIGILAVWSKSPYVAISLPAIKALANLDLDDFHHSYYDNGVYILHPYHRRKRNKEYHADIVFVHGLLGATFWTWRQHDSMKECNRKKVKTIHNSTVLQPAFQPEDDAQIQYTYCWPKDWLAEDFPDTRILSVDYYTCISKWKAECPQQEERDGIDAKASILIDKLLLSNIGEKPIIWVTHSMGGILVKQILLQSTLSKNNKVNAIAKKTAGVIFFGVPHKGSNLVNIFQSVPYIFQPSIDMGHLQKGSKKLFSLHESFKEIARKNNIAVLSFGETKKTKWGFTSGLLVSEDSSNPDFGEFLALPVDHLSTCKPESQESIVYTKIVEFLHTNIPKKIFLPQKFSKLEYEISNILCLIL